MPELAEVEYYRRLWDEAGRGAAVQGVRAHWRARIFRGLTASRLQKLVGERMEDSLAEGKQMLFRFGDESWLGIHLGMSGGLRAVPAGYTAGAHDHLVLATERGTLVFNDPRMFGRVRFDRGPKPPRWWTEMAPAVLSRAFTVAAVAEFLQRRKRSPIKSVLLMQERFPGIGNWMADEILWRAAIHPLSPAGSLGPGELRALWREARRVCRFALRRIAGQGGRLPAGGPHVPIPSSWLLPHRWEDGGICPRTGQPLKRAEIGGRTTCWSPARQKLHR
jgi:formamidopyrimidine-DNA glycosylase